MISRGLRWRCPRCRLRRCALRQRRPARHRRPHIGRRTGGPAVPATPAYAPVPPTAASNSPPTYGSHPEFRTEWWYVTGWLTTRRAASRSAFKSRFFAPSPPSTSDNPSAFAPRQLLIAHCAISDPKRGRLWQDQSIRRAGLGSGGSRGRRHQRVDRSLDAQARRRGSTSRASMPTIFRCI